MKTYKPKAIVITKSVPPEKKNSRYRKISGKTDVVELAERYNVPIIKEDFTETAFITTEDRPTAEVAIKETKEINPSIDILVISAWVSDDVSQEAIKLGATDYIVKPIDLTALSLKFANILDKRGQKISKT